jgi:hypothetical protein
MELSGLGFQNREKREGLKMFRQNFFEKYWEIAYWHEILFYRISSNQSLKVINSL